MKKIRTEDAVGHVLCHDITRIVRGEFKGPVFRKGHVVTEKDIPVLLSVGKENLYVWEKKEGWLHEDEGAERLYQLCANDHIGRTEAKEGKIEIFSQIDGLLKVDAEGLYQVNRIGELMIASRHGNFPVKKGDSLAGMRVIPLVIFIVAGQLLSRYMMKKMGGIGGMGNGGRYAHWNRRRSPGRYGRKREPDL